MRDYEFNRQAAFRLWADPAYRARQIQVQTTSSPEFDRAIRNHWGILPAREIGKPFGKSKSAVIGRAHRLGVAKKHGLPPHLS